MSMVDDDNIVRAMAATTLADETPFFSAGLKYVLVDIAKDFSIWKLRMESDLQGHGLWPLVEDGPTDAKAKRLMMQHLGDNIIREEGSAVGGAALWSALTSAYKDRMAFKMPHMIDEMETLKLKPGESIESLWSRMKILRADLLGLGYECTDQSIVQRIYRNLVSQPAWTAAMYISSETVLTVKLARFKIQLQLVEPALAAVVGAHAAQAAQNVPTVPAVVGATTVATIAMIAEETASGFRQRNSKRKRNASGARRLGTSQKTARLFVQ